MKSRSRFLVIAVLVVAVAAGVFIYPPIWNSTLVKAGLPEITEKPFRLGLDLLVVGQEYAKMAVAASTPRMTITTTNSIKVKPVCCVFIVLSE